MNGRNRAEVLVAAPAAAPLAPPAKQSRAAASQSFVADLPSLLSVVLGPVVAVAAGAGLFVPGVYRDAPTWVAQARGQDLVTLLVGVPLLVLGLIGARRGSMRAYLVWLGTVGYIAYAYATYAFAAHFNSLFLVYVAAFGLAIYTLVLGLIAADAASVARAFDRSTPTRLVGVSLAAMGGLTALLWLSQDIPAVVSGRVPSDVAEAGLLTNPVHVLDLGLVLPAAVLTGILLVQRRQWGFVLGAYFLVKFATLGLAIMSMTLFLRAEGQPFDVGMSAVFAIWTLGSLTLAWLFLARLHRTAVTA
jgi:hypothetical protein